MDCEMVETTKGSQLARISICDQNFNIIYD